MTLLDFISIVGLLLGDTSRGEDINKPKSRDYLMKIPELEKKYGKELIDKILKGHYLDGCTIAIVNGEDDIPESDIRLAIREINGDEICNWELD